MTFISNYFNIIGIMNNCRQKIAKFKNNIYIWDPVLQNIDFYFLFSNFQRILLL